MSEASQTEETKAQTTESQETKTTAESPATTPTPKKRGRPRKAPVPEGETPPKRRRGRPRKSETEAKAAAESATAAGAASPASSGADTPKKKRGRPKKEPGSEGPPKKRGRPRKVREEGAEAKPNDTTPKKRGRPRKNTATPSPGGTAASPAPAPAAAATVPITSETKESDAVHEPRMESRKRRRNASKSPVREKKSSKKESARKKLKYTEEEADKLDLEHLDRHSLQELQAYAREQKINMKLHGDRKADYIHAILLKQLSALTFDELKAEAVKRGVDMDDYGNTNKRKMDYIHALIDNRMGQEGEPLWELWKEIYLVGTEWENYDSVFDVNWDFDHLKEALEEGGDLYTAGSKHAVYLFGVTEPQLVKFEEKDRVVPIPAIVAVISSLPPPSELGLKSVQKIAEEFVPMKDLKMDWVPYIPKSEWKQDPKRVVPRAFFLKTHQRREGLKDMKEEEVVKFNFALPYIFLPRAQEEPTSDDTVVSVSTDVVNGKCTTFEFDWEMDEVEEIATDVLKDNDVNPAKNKEKLNDLIKAIKDTVNAEKQRIRDEKAKWWSRIEGLSAVQKKALDELQIWKFYPQNDYPDVSNNKVAFVNRYYGKADKVL